jgi:hypothetical protein
MLTVGLGGGFALNIAHHEPWAWDGFFFGVLGGLFGVFLYSRLGRREKP